MESYKDKSVLKIAFAKALPIMFTYFFMSTAYGLMMQEAGMNWQFSGLASIFVYTGAFQFVLRAMLASGASFITIALTALLVNSRQAFYALTFLNEYKTYKKNRIYMIQALTDETYAVNCSLAKDMPNRKPIMFYVSLFSHLSWITGSIVGGVAGQLLPINLDGCDFCMTALFVVIFIDQWEKAKSHIPAIIGLVVATVCLLIFKPDRFMLPALLITSALLIIYNAMNKESEARDVIVASEGNVSNEVTASSEAGVPSDDASKEEEARHE